MIALKAEGLGKSFTIAASGERPTVLARCRRALTGAEPTRELWALRGIDFELERGEALGVIGPNGAGKSTLLLLLAQILGPSEGGVFVRGKIDPLFQLGAGLRPRLSVLDNMRLCAALLGVPRRVFEKRLPEMIAFAGLEPYLHARYGELSAGYSIRLPFVVAAHADLDIVLLDEMLSVGDRVFQTKCAEVFARFKAERRTLVVVSHDLRLVEELCDKALYLDRGRQAYFGDVATAVSRYLERAPA